MFVTLANAYEILSDEAKRKRYDFLLEKGIKAYNPNMDWDRFDKMGLRSEREDFIFRDARAQFEDAQDANEVRAACLLLLVCAHSLQSWGFLPQILLSPFRVHLPPLTCFRKIL